MNTRSNSERRRSQRVDLVTTVEVAWHAKNGAYFTEHTETLVVSPHGALLHMNHELPFRHVVQLICSHLANWTLARVIRTAPRPPSGCALVGIELAVPSETFWPLSPQIPVPVACDKDELQ